MSAHRRQASMARLWLTRDEQVKLAQKQPRIVYIDMALIYVTLIAAFILLALVPSLFAKAIAFLVIGTRQYALFIIGHDGMHRNLHPRRVVNDRMTRWLVYAPLGMALDAGRKSHLDHHRLLGFENDPDRYLHGAENKSTWSSFLLFLTGLATFPKTVWKVSPFSKPNADPTAKRQSKSLSSLIVSWIPVVSVQLIIVAMMYGSPLTLWCYPLFWILPIYLLVFVPDETRAFCDHAHPVVPDRCMDEQRLITYVPPMWERCLFSPNHMNYHAEHHLWPFIPYYNLPRAHRLAIARAGEGIILRHSYISFLVCYFRSLPLRSVPAPRSDSTRIKTASAPLGSSA